VGDSTYKLWPIIAIVVGALLGVAPSAFAQTPEKESPPSATKPKAKTPPKTEAKTAQPKAKKETPAKVDPKKAKTTKDAAKKAAKKPVPTKKKKAAVKPLTKEEKEIVENLELLLLLELLNDYDLFDEEPK